MDGWASENTRTPGPPAGPAWMRWLVPLMIVSGVVFEFATPDPYRAGPMLAAAGPLAAVTLRFRAAVAAVLADGVVGVLLALGHTSDPDAHVWLDLVSLGAVLALSVLIAALLARGEDRLIEVRAVADAAQRAVLPTIPRRLGHLEVAVRYATARSAARIGGDFYAAEDTRYGVRLLLGDVRGKGLDGIGTVGQIVGAFREAAHHVPALAELAEYLEESTERWNASSQDSEADERFATAVLVELPRDEAHLRIVNRGHIAPLLLRGGGRLSVLEPSRPDLPLGFGRLAPAGTTGPAAVDVVPFGNGDTLLLYTDGVSEARDETGACFDLADALAGIVPVDLSELLWLVGDQVRAFSGGELADDTALMAVRRTE
ncbi:PP2C family protein-serine/threonine phosphatase [Streptodolium elevatio]|uniref:PP2C family protein-serine/threonine phosphatase n=1 Tax=Streptodolium elevatio TaxID=3157996 RepID=A0ABV3DH85_9ACTN